MKKELTCVVCPIGCKLTAEIENGKVISVTGNTCPRGKKYAESELTNPVRTLTSSVRIITDLGTRMLPVKTSSPIPKGKLFEAMEIIHGIKVQSPVKVGDVILSDFIEKGIDLVACKNM